MIEAKNNKLNIIVTIHSFFLSYTGTNSPYFGFKKNDEAKRIIEVIASQMLISIELRGILTFI